MNCKKTLASFFLCFILFSALGQTDYFVIKDQVKEKVRKFKEGKSFLYSTKTDSFFVKGKIQEIKDTSVVFYLPEELVSVAEVPLSEITVIRKPTTLQYAAYAVGALFMLNGAFFLLEGPAVTDYQVINRGLGAVSFATGLIPFLITPKTYEIGERYSISTELSEKEEEQE